MTSPTTEPLSTAPAAPKSAPGTAALGRPAPWVWAALALIVVLTAAARWHRLEVPMERDEGEYAYSGQLLLRGVPPYLGAYNMKLPGIYVAYAAVMAIFGETLRGVHLGLLVVNLASIVLVWRIGRRLLGDLAGVSAAAAFAALSIQSCVTGLFANSEHFVLLPVLGGALVLLGALESGRTRRFALAGLLFGIAFTVKQHAIAFAGFGGLLTALEGMRAQSPHGGPRSWRITLTRCGAYSLGAALPFAAICLWMALAGVFERFWFWTITYAAEYVSQTAPGEGLRNLTEQLGTMGGGLLGVWALAAIGLSSLAWFAPARRRWPFLVLFLACAAAAVCPGWMFRNHYFLYLLPPAALLVGAATAAIAARTAGFAGARGGVLVASTLVASSLAWAVASDWDVIAGWPDDVVSRKLYGSNPFPESLVIAEHVRADTGPDDLIAVIGSEPQIYFYSGRIAATGHIYTYALMEEHPFALQLQREMVRQIEAARPRYVVFVGVSTSWSPGPGSRQDIIEWAHAYIAAHYEWTGLVTIRAAGTEYLWGAEAVRGRTQSDDPWVGVYRRKPD